MDKFGYQVDFIAVGDKSKSGDAIAIRWGEHLDSAYSRQYVMLIDGGHSCSAQDVVRHIKTYYYNNPAMARAKTKVDLIINTHPHSDHFGGIPLIYDETNVGSVALHRPWAHTSLIKWFHDGRVTTTGIKKQLKDGLEGAYEFSKKYAREKGAQTCELFGGQAYRLPFGVELYILGPSKDFYDKLLPDFNSTPTKGDGVGNDRIVLKGYDVPAYKGNLTDGGDTSAENLSGLIVALKMPNKDILLFTGDAGMDSLWPAMRQFTKFQLDRRNIRFFQVPHHGSCQNLGPSILDFIFGRPDHPNQTDPVSAYISVAANPDYEHPSRRVINALCSRNCEVFKTQGRSLSFQVGNVPCRNGWVAASKLTFSDFVEG